MAHVSCDKCSSAFKISLHDFWACSFDGTACKCDCFVGINQINANCLCESLLPLDNFDWRQSPWQCEWNVKTLYFKLLLCSRRLHEKLLSLGLSFWSLLMLITHSRHHKYMRPCLLPLADEEKIVPACMRFLRAAPSLNYYYSWLILRIYLNVIFLSRCVSQAK